MIYSPEMEEKRDKPNQYAIISKLTIKTNEIHINVMGNEADESMPAGEWAS